ncbi:prepilin-type N-terminal cleavage/methylation domain-containing protein [Candidatus Sumerlaeota bacterium]|nr:prepilin-type N-terminal cleavage/methylation domain-containing protein [Candidatus Sumerlaeota bacterium]
MKSRRTQKGFSIIEILIAVIIIGILTLILVPTLLNRAQSAKITACHDELERLAEAQKRAALESGHYCRLFVLDDLPGDGDGRGWFEAPNDRIDAFEDEIYNEELYQVRCDSAGIYNLAGGYIKVFIDFSTHDFVKGTETSYDWKGPYFSIRRDDPKPLPTDPDPPDPTDEDANVFNIPNDPWGHDYLFFMPRRVVNGILTGGIVAEPRGVIQTQWSYGDVTYDDSIVVVFDRPTILSMGPNGLPGDPNDPNPDDRNVFGKGDDVFLSFEF